MKTVVITGAGGVLCGMLAVYFAEKGNNVALLDVNEENARKNAGNIPNAKAYACNVLDRESLEEVKSKIMMDFGKCDILINGAGGNHPKATTDDEFYEFGKDCRTFFDLETEGVEFVFNLNYMGTLIPTQVFARDMEKGGVIINISSMNSFTPLTKIPAYSGAKSAVSNLTKWLAVYFAKYGIRCNAIAPGFFISKQNEKLLFDDSKPTPRAEKILKNTPMGRFGNERELIGAVEFLADNEKSSFVNGIVLPVDGGFSAYSGV